MIISVNVEKAFDNIQQPFMIKTVNTIVMEGTYLKTKKVIYTNPTTNTIITEENLKALQDIVQDRVSHCHLFYSTQYWKFWPEQLDKKRNKRNPNQKEEVELAVFR